MKVLTHRLKEINQRLLLILILIAVFALKGNYMLAESNTIVNVVQQQQAQSIRVTGNVVDETNEPLMGVSVVLVGSTTGVITDLDGNFSIEVPSSKSVLKFSYIGYNEKTVNVGTQRRLSVILEENTQMLEDIVVVGYGSQRKVSTTASVVSIGNKEILQSPAANIANTLVGRLPGLTAIQQSGLPGGDKPILRIRGISTLSSGYVSEPLVLVDGIERAFDQLDPNEIETVSILKDASATAVFGVRGANGVIIVTTKRGLEGAAKVSVSSNFSIQQPINVPDMLTSANYAMLFNEANVNDGKAWQFPQWQVDAYRTGSDPVLFPSIDWFDYLLKDVSTQQQHNLNISGGTENVKYFISIGYLHQDGLWKAFQADYSNNNTYDRYNFRSNFDINITKTLTASINLGGRIEQRHSPNTDINEYFAWVYTCPPNTSAGIVDDKLVLFNQSLGPKREPFSQIARSGYRENMASNVDIKIDLKQKLDFITPGLSAKVGYAYDSYYAFNTTRAASIPAYYVDRGLADIGDDGIEDVFVKYSRSGTDGPLGYSTSFGKNRKMYIDAALNYNRTFDSNHYITGLFLYNQDKEWYPRNIGRETIPRAYIGFVGRATYDYKHRYLAEFNVGYNGSENFHEERRFGLFPAYSIGWGLSEEPWMKEQDIVSYMKIKASYGKVGNDRSNKDRFLYTPSAYQWGGGAFFGTDPQWVGGAIEDKVGNPFVTWEIANKTNIALESKFLKDKLTLNFDYFTEKREKILTDRLTVPGHVAAVFQPSNIGKVNSYGFEAELGWNSKINSFEYFVKGNFSFSRNKIIEFDEVLREESWLNTTGMRVGQYRGLKSIGLVNEPEQLTDPNLPIYDTGKAPQLGDLLYEDYKKDGVIDYKDVQAIGYSQWPEITFGVNLGFNYKGFSMSALFQGTENVSNYYSGDVRVPFLNDGSVFTYHTGRWTPDTKAEATYPRLTMDNKHSNYVGLGNVSSDYWLKDASYLRLKNVELAYLIKPKFLKNALGVNSVRVNLNANNLYTWSKLKIFDPESTPGGPYRYPQLTTYNLGVNVQF